jgi:hypothetical protein
MSIEIGPVYCDKCLYVDNSIAVNNNYKMQSDTNKYNYLLHGDNSAKHELESNKLIEKINLINIKSAVIIQHYRFGRFGNYLFTIADLAIIYEKFKNTFASLHDDVEMLTNWHETYFTDVQSREANIYKYKHSDTPLSIYKNIKCRHFAHNDIFCKHCVKTISIINDIMLLHLVDTDGRCYGFVKLFRNGNIFALHIMINEMTDHYFSFDNIQFNGVTSEMIDEFKYKYYLNPTCKKVVSIGGYLFGCDSQMMRYFSTLSVRYNYKIRLYFNFDYLLKHKETLLKYIFSDHDHYKLKYEQPVLDNVITVCGHLRAGDYSVGNTFTYYVLYYTYYLTCLEDIQDKNPGKQINFILSFHPNDIKLGQFYRRKLQEKLPNITILFEEDLPFSFKNEIDHISYMALYGNYYIASNSSYSFWSVFLKRDDTIVYYPKYYGIKYEGNNIHNIKKTEDVLYTYKDFLYPDKYIAISCDKVLHPAYYAVLMDDIKIKDLRKPISILFDREELIEDTAANICLKNVLITETLTSSDKNRSLVNKSCNDRIINAFDGYNYDVHIYHLSLHKQFVISDKYNFNKINEIYTDSNGSIIEYVR